GTPSEIYSTPASEFVATFIGSPSMNLLKGRITEDGNHVQIGDKMRWHLPQNTAATPGQAVSVGIRPEHITIDNTASDTALAVDLVENLGADALIHGRLADTPVVIRLPGNASIQ